MFLWDSATRQPLWIPTTAQPEEEVTLVPNENMKLTNLFGVGILVELLLNILHIYWNIEGNLRFTHFISLLIQKSIDLVFMKVLLTAFSPPRKSVLPLSSAPWSMKVLFFILLRPSTLASSLTSLFLSCPSLTPAANPQLCLQHMSKGLHIQGQEELLWPFFQSIHHRVSVEIWTNTYQQSPINRIWTQKNTWAKI